MPAELNLCRLVLFDFDGTLADTARDMINALNMLLKNASRPPVNYEELRAFVSNGTPALLKKGFDCSPGDAEFEPLRKQFLRTYEDNVCVHTTLYPGTEEILEKCRNSGIAWGIVTNKPEYLTLEIVEKLGLSDKVACVVGGDTLAKRKPDPEPVIHACALAGVAPQDAVFVGDSSRDIEAGRRAGLITVGVTYGYIPPDDDPQTWEADHVIDSMEEIAGYLWSSQPVPSSTVQ